jgi:hypothetical protein
LSRVKGARAAALRQEQRAFLATRDRLFGRPDYQLKVEMERRLAQLTALNK